MSLTHFGGHVGEKHKTSRPPANKGLQKRVKGEPLVWTCVVALVECVKFCKLGGHGAGHAAFRSSIFLCSLRSSMLMYRLASIQFSLVSTASALTSLRQLSVFGKMRTT
jgi:hypothetical protein